MATDKLVIFGTEYDGVTGIIAKDDVDTNKTFIRPQGTKSITQNGTGIDVVGYASVDVNVSGGITPTGNIDITEAGVTDVTEYATATVPTATADCGGSGAYSTESGVRKWKYTSTAYAEDAGWVNEGTFATKTSTYNAVPKGTAITPTESTQTVGGSNYHMEGAVTVNAIPSNYVGSGITRRSSSDLTASGATVTVPSGYYSAQASKSVSTGTAGNPTATKGTVSNHAISVTPSVTNTTGYITGGTKTGTAVSVSASELVSGTYTVSASGSHDVTNYASASVASGTATASASKGTVSNHSVTVTPSVTRTAGYITAGSASGTAVTVSASELVSGSQTITQNGTVDVTNLASVTVEVQGGGSTGPQMGQASRTLASASSSISFTGLQGEPTSFLLSCTTSLTTGASPFKVGAVVFDGTNLHGQIVTNTSNAQATYDGSSFSKTYSNGTLTVSSTGPYFQATEYVLDYSYGGTSANVVTQDKQVGSGATSIEFTNLPEATPLFYSVIFKSNFSTSSGYQRVMWVGNRLDGEGGFGMAMDSQANVRDDWNTYGIGTGSMTVTSNSTSQGGYFHQPGYYQLTAVYGDVEPQEIDVVPLSVTQNGTYTAQSGTAYSPVTVNVSGGGANFATATMTNSSNQNTSISFTLPSGRTPKAFFARLTSQIARSSNSRYYYVFDMRWDGSSTGGVAGNTFYMYNGTLTNVTSGYSYSQSGTTFTLSSTGARNTSPGSFYNGTYELVYVY